MSFWRAVKIYSNMFYFLKNLQVDRPISLDEKLKEE